MFRFHFAALCAVVATVASLAATPPAYAQPIQTVNIDFGSLGGFQGPLSSLGGTVWNRVTAGDLTSGTPFFPSGAGTLVDEFGVATGGLEIGRYSPGASSVDQWQDVPNGVAPDTTDGGVMTLFRVQELHELVLLVDPSYAAMLLSPAALPEDESGFYMGQFYDAFSGPDVLYRDVVDSSATSSVGLLTTTALHFTQGVPLTGGLGEAPSYSVYFANDASSALIHGIQIRGRFQGVPEPSTLLLLAAPVGLLSRRARRPGPADRG